MLFNYERKQVTFWGKLRCKVTVGHVWFKNELMVQFVAVCCEGIFWGF